jgi:anti-sigma factor RsiW
VNAVCVEIVELLIDYVDGDLPEDRRAEFERHMCGCLPCFAYLETYQATIRLTRALPRCEPLPPEFERRLRAMLDAEASVGRPADE